MVTRWVLDVPSLGENTWAGRHSYEVELEECWGLGKAFAFEDESAFFAELERLLGDLDPAHGTQAKGSDAGMVR